MLLDSGKRVAGLILNHWKSLKTEDESRSSIRLYGLGVFIIFIQTNPPIFQLLQQAINSLKTFSISNLHLIKPKSNIDHKIKESMIWVS